jgi:hypothetical protein
LRGRWFDDVAASSGSDVGKHSEHGPRAISELGSACHDPNMQTSSLRNVLSKSTGVNSISKASDIVEMNQVHEPYTVRSLLNNPFSSPPSYAPNSSLLRHWNKALETFHNVLIFITDCSIVSPELDILALRLSHNLSKDRQPCSGSNSAYFLSMSGH